MTNILARFALTRWVDRHGRDYLRSGVHTHRYPYTVLLCSMRAGPKRQSRGLDVSVQSPASVLCIRYQVLCMLMLASRRRPAVDESGQPALRGCAFYYEQCSPPKQAPIGVLPGRKSVHALFASSPNGPDHLASPRWRSAAKTKRNNSPASLHESFPRRVTSTKIQPASPLLHFFFKSARFSVRRTTVRNAASTQPQPRSTAAADRLPQLLPATTQPLIAADGTLVGRLLRPRFAPCPLRLPHAINTLRSRSHTDKRVDCFLGKKRAGPAGHRRLGRVPDL